MQDRSAFKSYYLTQERQTTANYYGNMANPYDTRSYMPQESLPVRSKVFVNPNYTSRKPVIHVNPHAQVQPPIFMNPHAQVQSPMYVNPLVQMVPPIYANPFVQANAPIHVNPKLIMQNITSSRNQEQIPRNVVHGSQSVHATIPSTRAVHVNPKLMKQLISNVPRKNCVVQQTDSIPNALHFQNISVVPANPMRPSEPNSSSVTSSAKRPISQRTLSESSNQTKTKLVKNNVTPKKSPNTGLVSLSQRKLVRMRKSPRVVTTSSSSLKSVTPSRRRLSSSGSRKGKCSSNINNSKPHNVWYNKNNKTVLKSPQKKVVIGKT